MMSTNYGLLAFDPMRSFFARNFHSSPTNGSNIGGSSSSANIVPSSLSGTNINPSQVGDIFSSAVAVSSVVTSGSESSLLNSKAYDPEPPQHILQQQQQQQQRLESSPNQTLISATNSSVNLTRISHLNSGDNNTVNNATSTENDSLMAEIAMHKIMQQHHQQQPNTSNVHQQQPLISSQSHHLSGSMVSTMHGFDLHEQMTAHLAATAGDKDFLCEICCKRFTQKGNLKTHIRSVHTKEKPFSCPVCGKCFSQKGNMQTHTRTHNKDDRFPCVLCGKKFSQKGNLKTHMQRHSGAIRASQHFVSPHHHQSSLFLHSNRHHHHVNPHHLSSHHRSNDFVTRQRAMSFSSAFGAALNLGSVNREDPGSNPDDLINSSSLSDDETSSICSELQSPISSHLSHSGHSGHLDLAPRSFSFSSSMSRPSTGNDVPNTTQQNAQQAVEFHQRSMSFNTSDAAAAAAAAAARAAALYGSTSGVNQHPSAWFTTQGSKRLNQRSSNTLTHYDPFSSSNYGATLSRLSFFSAAGMHQAFNNPLSSNTETVSLEVPEELPKSPEATNESNLIEPQIKIVVEGKEQNKTDITDPSIQQLQQSRQDEIDNPENNSEELVAQTTTTTETGNSEW